MPDSPVLILVTLTLTGDVQNEATTGRRLYDVKLLDAGEDPAGGKN